MDFYTDHHAHAHRQRLSFKNSLRLIIVEQNNQEATSVPMQKDMRWILRNSFLFVTVSFALGIFERCEYTNCSSERDGTSPAGPLELVVKEPPGRDRNWLTGLPEIVVDETKFAKFRHFYLEIKPRA
jgi:hypothetical protein